MRVLNPSRSANTLHPRLICVASAVVSSWCTGAPTLWTTTTNHLDSTSADVSGLHLRWRAGRERYRPHVRILVIIAFPTLTVSRSEGTTYWCNEGGARHRESIDRLFSSPEVGPRMHQHTHQPLRRAVLSDNISKITD